MATPTYAQVAQRWYAIACTGRGTHLRHPHMTVDGDVLVGADGVPLVQVLREKNGLPRLFLLNGDGSRSRRFRNQQWEVRAVIQRQVFDHAILPYVALEAAGIERHTIIPIDVREDTWVRERRWFSNFDEKDIVWNNESTLSRTRTGRIPNRPDLIFYQNTHAYAYNGYTRIKEGDRSLSVRTARGFALTQGHAGWFFEEQRHRLGDAVFRAKAHGAYRTFVSSFDYQETNPLYFLAELPWKARVSTVTEAIEALQPPIVRQAFTQKRLVQRQGDIFSIPTELTTEQVRERTNGELLRMRGVLGTDHVVTEQYVGRRGVTYARGFMWHKPEGRRPDHGRVCLGSKWHLVVPNAVPRRRAGAMVRG